MSPPHTDDVELKEAPALVASSSHTENIDIDPKLERRLKWKLDLFILPLLSSVYFFASMGRSDLGNAQVAGMSEELRLSPRAYSNAANMFLVGYVLFQLPGTLLIKRIGPSRQFGGAMILWGTFTAVTVTIKNSGELLGLRFLIGTAEAFVQGGVFYLSFWYRYRELATRGAVFYSMSTLAGAFNGLIAYGIAKNLNGANGWLAWRWIFLIEGILPIGFSALVLIFLPASPETLRFGFSKTEKELAIQRSRETHNTSESRLEVKKVPLVLLSLHFWLFVIIYCASHFCLSSISNFLPAIIHGFGYNTVQTQLLTVAFYICGCVGVLFWSRVADITNARGFTLVASSIGAVVGYVMLIAITGRDARLAATCLVAFSMYPNIVLLLSWSAMSFAGYTRRGSALAFINIFSQLFAISGNHAYADPPYYRKGNTASLAMSVIIVVAALVLRWYLGFLNTKKKEMQSSLEAAEQRQKSMEELGDKHPDFFYTL